MKSRKTHRIVTFTTLSETKIKYSTPDSIIEEGLHEFLTETKNELFAIGKTLSKNYFGYT